MIDSTAVRATRASSGAGKKGEPEEPLGHALERSRSWKRSIPSTALYTYGSDVERYKGAIFNAPSITC